MNLDIISRLTDSAAVVAILGGSGNVAVVAVAEVETLLAKVEALIVGAGQVQTIDTAQVEAIVGTRVGRGQTNFISGEPDTIWL